MKPADRLLQGSRTAAKRHDSTSTASLRDLCRSAQWKGRRLDGARYWRGVST